MLKTIFFTWKNIPPFFCCQSFLTYFCTPKNALCASAGNDSVAQLVEQYTFNVWVLGSSPSGITNKVEAFKSADLKAFCFCRFCRDLQSVHRQRLEGSSSIRSTLSYDRTSTA